MTKTTAYLIIGRPDHRNAPANIRTIRKNRPALAVDEIAVKVVLDIPWDVWAEFIPEVMIEVAAPHVFPPVVAYVEDATTDDEHESRDPS